VKNLLLSPNEDRLSPAKGTIESHINSKDTWFERSPVDWRDEVKNLVGRWQFYQDVERRWRWRCHADIPEKAVESEQSFERFTDALVDAGQHGFVMARRSRPPTDDEVG
jgi:hypothetical protein